jgi:hypothetical protein
MSKLKCKKTYGQDLILIANALAVSLTENLSTQDMTILASFLVTLSDSIATIAAVTEKCEDEEN